MHAVMTQIDVLLLLALPASGKSEVRRYLDHLDDRALREDMHLGPTVQLDDYPYVHVMRRIAHELNAIGEDPIFFTSDESPWRDPHDWLTLVHLLNEDFRGLQGEVEPDPRPSALLDRFDRARRLAGPQQPFASMDPRARERVESGIAADAELLSRSVPHSRPDGATVVIEFARGGPTGAELPLPHPLGYRSSLAALADEILRDSAALYVWAEPEESRRRNRERALPGREGDASILHHGVPEAVMTHEYGIDDIGWLERNARAPGTIPVGDEDVPFARFDNRDDRTSFLRADPSQWDEADVRRLHSDLSTAFTRLAEGVTGGVA